MDIKQIFSSILGADLRYHESYKGIDKPVYCDGCYVVISGPAYVSQYQAFALHKACAESPSEIQHPVHPHHALMVDISINRLVCQGCGKYSFGYGYCCDVCHFILDMACASNISIQQEEKIMEIKEDFHDHKLRGFNYNTTAVQRIKDIFCSYCTKSLDGSGFACTMCHLLIHKHCIPKVPRGKEIRSPFHLQHPLLLESAWGYSRGFCLACYENPRPSDMVLSCHMCDINEGFHLSCARVNTSGLSLKQYHEDHPMFYAFVRRDFGYSGYFPRKKNRKRRCLVCNNRCGKCHVYSCLDCDVSVHLECIPLPRVLKHQSHSYDDHDHVLTLFDSASRQDFPLNQYYCFLCEKEADTNCPFHHCKPCSEIFHIDCILSEVSKCIVI